MQQIINNGLPGYSEVPVQGSNFCWEEGIEQEPEEFSIEPNVEMSNWPEYLNCLCRYNPQAAWDYFQANCSYYLDVYWYTPDYLGNTEYITDLSGAPFQYFYYSPFGEAIVSQHAQTGNYNSPFRFNAKELDSETGLYYYGARYYSPRTSIWLSVDPLAHKSITQTPYHFVSGNPIMIIDPDGRHGYRVDQNGYIHKIDAELNPEEAASGGDEFDVLYNDDLTQTAAATYVKGTFDEIIEAKAKDQLGVERTYHRFGTFDHGVANVTYEFLMNNTNVEWSLLEGDWDKSRRFNLITSHAEGYEIGGPDQAIRMINNGYTNIVWSHSHPISEGTKAWGGPSGGYHENDRVESGHGDNAAAIKLESVADHKKVPHPRMNVYDVRRGERIWYNSKGIIK